MPEQLLAFLRARLDEEAEAATDATEGPWYAEHPEGRWGDDREARLIGQGKILGTLSNDYNGHLNADHIARHDPARILAEVAAWRTVLTQYEHLMHDVMPDDLTGVWAIEAIMRAKAAVYADHPDYREEWRP